MPNILTVLWIIWLFASTLPASSEVMRKPNYSSVDASRKVAIVHMHDEVGFYHKLGELTLSNKQRYAKRHGYEMVWHVPQSTQGLVKVSPECNLDWQQPHEDNDAKNCLIPANDEFALDSRAPTFGKVKLIRAACVGRKGYWLLWSDADALIVNQSIPVTNVIDDNYDIIFSVDWLMLNAGVILVKCTTWTERFLKAVYDDRKFEGAKALDQSAFQHFAENFPGATEHIGYIAKHLINSYAEEYRPGDFLVHLAGKLYEATTTGAVAIAQQFDVLSIADDFDDVDAFFSSIFFLNKYSGLCVITGDDPAEVCPVIDSRRIALLEPLGSISFPYRYRHVGLRYYWLTGWLDKHDIQSSQVRRMSSSDQPEHDEL